MAKVRLSFSENLCGLSKTQKEHILKEKRILGEKCYCSPNFTYFKFFEPGNHRST
jgi:hypothetical protein